MAKSVLTAVAEHGTCAGYQRVRRNGCKPIQFTSAVLLGLVFFPSEVRMRTKDL